MRSVPDTRPEFEAWVSDLLGLYRDEVTKQQAEADCRTKVRAENAGAAK